MKDKIIKVLQAHPRGLRAKDIAYYITNTDRRMINQVLYSNPDSFQISTDYVWTLKTLPHSTIATKSNTPSSKKRASFNYEQWYSNYRKEQEKKEKKAQKAREIISKINKEKLEKEILLSSKDSTSSGDQSRVKRVTEWEKKQAEELLRKERIEKRREEKRQEEELVKSFHSGIYSPGNLHVCIGDCSTCEKDQCPVNTHKYMLVNVKSRYRYVPIYRYPNYEHRVGYTQDSVLSIVEVRPNNWGKLSSGAGWIDLSYTEFIK